MKKGFTYVRGKKEGRRIYICMRQEVRKKALKYVRGKKDGRKDLNMYAVRRTGERVYICTRREGRKKMIYICTRQGGRKKGFTYVRGKKDARKDLHMYAARRT